MNDKYKKINYNKRSKICRSLISGEEQITQENRQKG